MNGTFARKQLPSVPGQNAGYGGGAPQNGYGMRNEGGGGQSYGSSRMVQTSQEPPARAILDGYEPDIVNGFDGEAPLYNPVSNCPT